MPRSPKSRRFSEHEVKLRIGDWLAERGVQVFDEEQNKERPQWKVFEVRNIDRGKRPDLLVRGNLTAGRILKHGAYVAVEIKCGYKHQDILDGFDAILNYFSDYLWSAEYYVDARPIELDAFVLATFFSQEGFLFQGEGKFPPQIVSGPWDAYPMTFTIARLLWRQKDNLVKRFQVLSGIPKIERKLKGEVRSDRPIPEIGVLVLEPKHRRSLLLMLSRNPYHWRFEGG